MSQYKYSLNKYEENMARGVARDISISFKQAIEISSALRNKEISKAKALLSDVLIKKRAIPFKRFTNGLGHKPGMCSGRYPLKACNHFLKLLNEVEANAQNKGLGKCKIIHINAQKASRPFHYGRLIRRKMKRAHVEIVVKEIEPIKDKKSKQKSTIKDQGKQVQKTG